MTVPDQPGITAEEFRHLTRLCERVLINALTPPDELRDFLAARLRGLAHRELALRIDTLNDPQMLDLRDGVLAALRSGRPLVPVS